MAIALCVIGILAGGLVTFLLARRSDKKTSRKLVAMERRLISHGVLLHEALGHLQESEPEVAACLTEKLRESEANQPPEAFGPLSEEHEGQPGNVADGNACSTCHEGRFLWSRWGPGPFGAFTAWYVCNKCGAELPSNEVFGD